MSYCQRLGLLGLLSLFAQLINGIPCEQVAAASNAFTRSFERCQTFTAPGTTSTHVTTFAATHTWRPLVLFTSTPTRTITPRPAVVTSTSTTTQTTSVKSSIDTLTMTEVDIFMETTTLTDTITDESTTFETTTSQSTSTVSTPSDFRLPLTTAPPALASASATTSPGELRRLKRDADPNKLQMIEKPLQDLTEGREPLHKALWMSETHVHCFKTVDIFIPVTWVRTAWPRTTYAPTSTSTATTVTTSMFTAYPAKVTTTWTTSTTRTSTVHDTSTTTTTITETVIVQDPSVPTVYQACIDPRNIVDKNDKGTTLYYAADAEGSTYSHLGSAVSGPTECCELCQTTPNCMGSHYQKSVSMAYSDCDLYIANSGTCPNQQGIAGEIAAGASWGDLRNVFSNGNCGHWALRE